jgi:hypothetical protein
VINVTGMSIIVSIIFFAAFATAQLTTSFWQPNIYLGTTKVGYYGSVIGVDKDRTTIAIKYDNNTNPEHFATDDVETITFASTLWEAYTANIRDLGRDTTSDRGNYAYNLACQKATSARATPVCTISRGPGLAHDAACPATFRSIYPAITTTLIYTYSADVSGTAGIVTTTVETTLGGPPKSMDRPWCSGSSGSIPGSFVENEMTLEFYNAATYQLVITAGEEKLSATTGASAATPGPQATGSQAIGSQASSGLTSTARTGAAMPMKTVAPALVVLSAAAAAFLL